MAVQQQQVGWVAGLAVSAGVGAAVLFGGAAVAVAETSDASSAADGAGSADSAGGAVSSSAADADDGSDHDAVQSVSATDPGADGDDDEDLTESLDDESLADSLDDEDVSESLDDESFADSLDDEAVAGDIVDEVIAADIEVSAESSGGDVDEIGDSLEDGATAAGGGDSPSLPAQTQAVATLVSSASRRSDDLEDRAAVVAAGAEVANSAPVITTSVGMPDGLTGVTRVTVTGDDPDGDVLVYTAGRAMFGRVTGDGSGEFTYSPTSFARLLARFLPFIRSDRFSVTVSDGRGGVTSSTVTTAIVPLNSAPRARATTLNAPAPGTGVVTGKANAFDPNWDATTFVASTFDTAKGTVTTRRDGTFAYTPRLDARHLAAAATATRADRTDTFRLTVSDRYGAVTEIPVTVTIIPFNTAPTGTATVQDPDESGVVTGIVIGADADGDGLTYAGSAITAKGTVEVSADGAITYLPNEKAMLLASSMYATPASRSDTFDVTIADGYGGVTIVAVSVAITPDPSPSVRPPSTFCGCTLMPADTIFHADIRDLPKLSESDGWIELLGGSQGATLRANWGGLEWMGSTGGIPVNVVGPDHPTETVVFNRGYSTSGPGIDDSPYAIPDRPLVEGMPSYPAWDRHLFVFQEGTCISQELINVANGVELPGAGILDILGNAVYRSIWGSSWIAAAGVHYDMSSPLYPVIGHANASRLPQVPMMLRPDEIERGYIDHILGITIAKDLGADYVWPARAGDGSGADGVPMGMVFRLREDIDLSGYSESTQAVLRALQIHGAVIYDSGGPGRQGINLAGMSNGWEGTDFVDMQRELSTIPVQWFEAVDAVSLAADPTIGWQVR